MLTSLYTFSVPTYQLFCAYMQLFLPHGFVISTGACADTKILISSDFTSAEYIYQFRGSKKDLLCSACLHYSIIPNS